MMREMMPQLDILCHQMKLLMPGMGYILLSHWSERYHGMPQTTQTMAKAIGYTLQCDSKALLLDKTLICVIQDGDVELVPTRSFTPIDMHSWHWQGLWMLLEEKR